MAIRLNNNSIFIHIPKTGGQWVAHVLRLMGLYSNKEKQSHLNVKKVKEYLKEDVRFFGFIRHPLEWFKSSWSQHRDDPGVRERNLTCISRGNLWTAEHSGRQFADFMQGDLNVALEKMIDKYPGFISWLFNEYTEGLDYVGRFEYLRIDLEDILKNLGFKLTIKQIDIIENEKPSNVHGAKHTEKFSQRLIDKLFETESCIEKYNYSYIPRGLV